MTHIVQFTNALVQGDAVTGDLLMMDRAFRDLGHETSIAYRYTNFDMLPSQATTSMPAMGGGMLAVLHFAGNSEWADGLSRKPCKKVMKFHNVTPPLYFSGMKTHELFCIEGLRQLKRIARGYEAFWCDSEFNALPLRGMGCANVEVMPLFLDFAEWLRQPCNEALMAGNRRGKTDNFLFVGRVVPNKAIHLLLDAFDAYNRLFNGNSRLFIVGNHHDYPEYFGSLLSRIASRSSGRAVTFAGKVSGGDLMAYYRSADIYLCMSEHEGFCLPLVESMLSDILTVAYKAGAVETTMGPAGVKLLTRDAVKAAALCRVLIEDADLASRIRSRQREWVEQFGYPRNLLRIRDLLAELGYD